MAVLQNGLDTIELGRTRWRDIVNSNTEKIDDFMGNVTGDIVKLDTTTFNNNLTSAEDTVQKALEKIDDLNLGGGRSASDVSVITTNFNNNLTSAEDTVQKCLEKLDDLTAGGGSGGGTLLNSNNNIKDGTNNLSAVTTETNLNNIVLGFNNITVKTNPTKNIVLGEENLKGNDGTENIILGYTNLNVNKNTNSWNQTRAENNILIGKEVLKNGEYTYQNIAIGKNILQSGKIRLNNILIGNNLGTYFYNYEETIMIGNGIETTANNQVQLGNINQTVYTWSRVQTRSDFRDKTEIKDIDKDLAFNFIINLRPKGYKSNFREAYYDIIEKKEIIQKEIIDENGDTKIINEEIIVTEKKEVENDGSRAGKRFHRGLIAQEVKQVSDDLGFDFAGYQDHSKNGGKDVKSLGYQELIPFLIACNKKLIDEIEILKEKVGILENK